jgi:hypothetical protein
MTNWDLESPEKWEGLLSTSAPVRGRGEGLTGIYKVRV